MNIIKYYAIYELASVTGSYQNGMVIELVKFRDMENSFETEYAAIKCLSSITDDYNSFIILTKIKIAD